MVSDGAATGAPRTGGLNTRGLARFTNVAGDATGMGTAAAAFVRFAVRGADCGSLVLPAGGEGLAAAGAGTALGGGVGGASDARALPDKASTDSLVAFPALSRTSKRNCRRSPEDL